MCLVSTVILSGCASISNTPSEKTRLSLSETLETQNIIPLPYTTYGKGIYVVQAKTGDGVKLDLAIDTGATQSALYRSALKKVRLAESTTQFIQVHGMNQKESRPSVFMPTIYFGAEEMKNFRMAVLEDREDPLDNTQIPDGLIGMDVLGNYRIYVDADTKTFNLIPKAVPAPHLPSSWESVTLLTNPFIEDDHDLHFLEMRLGNYLIPALLDTGSEDNLMNWSVSMFPQLRRARKKLREQWMIEGAVGTFDPQHLIATKNLRSGEKLWQRSEFLVMDFVGLDILGINDQPFLIAGAQLFADQTFYLDFTENVIRFKPPAQGGRARSLVTTHTVYRDKDRTE